MPKVRLKDKYVGIYSSCICDYCMYDQDVADDWSALEYRCVNCTPRSKKISDSECDGFIATNVSKDDLIIEYPECYGITDKRLHRILGVSRRAYHIAKERGHDEDFARKMFMIGWLHEVGYEFSEREGYYKCTSGDMIKLLFDVAPKAHSYSEFLHTNYYDYRDSSLYQSITKNEWYRSEKIPEEYDILTLANMQVGSDGEIVKEYDEKHILNNIM